MTERTLAPCGTAAAARRHYARGERPCGPCAAAWREAAAARYHSGKGQDWAKSYYRTKRASEGRPLLDSAPEKPCEICGSTFQPKNARHRYCSDPCRTRALVESEAYKRAQAKRRPTKGYKRPTSCAECGVEFVPSKDRPQKYCSKQCKHRAAKKRRPNDSYKPVDPAQTRANRRRRTATLALERAAKGSSSGLVATFGPCAECGEVFTRVEGLPTKYCSPRCGRSHHKAKRRARKRDAYVAPVNRLAVFERDDWTCWICGDAIDRTLKTPDLGAPVIDHAVALAAGGTHEPDNCRAAHFYCNSVKRDLDIADVA